MNNKLSMVFGLGILLAAGLSWALVPRETVSTPMPDFEKNIPTKFGDWQMVDTGFIQTGLVPKREGAEPTLEQPYDQTLMRTYRNKLGEYAMLAIAYGRKQRQEIKIHRPELCYISNGYRVLSKRPTQIKLDNGAIPAIRMITSNGKRMELVTYWIRIGDRHVNNAWESRILILKEGLAGNIPDGVLVRVSTSVVVRSENMPAEFELHQSFISELMNYLDPAIRRTISEAASKTDSSELSLPMLEKS